VQLLGICGSSASSRRTLALIEQALNAAQESDSRVQIDLVDLSKQTLDFCDGRPLEDYNTNTKEVLKKIEKADGFLFGSPMYRGTMTGALKNLIDLIPDTYIRGKAAGMVATGGSGHHYLGLDLGFRTAMSFFQVHTIPGVLYQSRFTIENGQIVESKVREEATKFGEDLVRLIKMTDGKVLGPKLY
jgi:NAD(P)H-dependent FMN reductase